MKVRKTGESRSQDDKLIRVNRVKASYNAKDPKINIPGRFFIVDVLEPEILKSKLRTMHVLF
jgi:hypothetical protein